MDPAARIFSRMDDSIDKKMEEPTLEAADFDIDFGVTESGRTMILGKYGGEDDATFDDMEFSISNSGRNTPISSSGRNIETGNVTMSERTMSTIGTVGSMDSSISPSILDSTRSVPDNKSRENELAASSQTQATTQNSTSTDQQRFQPLLPLPEHPRRERSAPRAIPAAPQIVPPQQSALGSQSNSAGSSGSAFLNNILNHNMQMSHTPPTHISTSYEVSHFGKRARSGSISERLRVSSELEEKGMIDREQKGILKDLIISGQDDELQHALDRYEMGDAKLLEEMLDSGTLLNRATTDIDLLGDLDLDFLNVNDDDPEDSAHLNHPYNSANHPMQPPPSLPTREQVQHMAVPAAAGSCTVSFNENSDGIGELDFDGGIGGSDGYAPMHRAPSPMYQAHGQRSRSNSTFSMDLDFRARSNSLFSALVGDAPQEGREISTPVPDYGRWMEGSPDPYTAEGILDRPLRRASAPEIPSGLSSALSSSHNETENVEMTPAEKRELRAEEKRRERQERKDQKEKEKIEKKEKREQAKLEKQKKAEKDDKEEHQPGSGRPRSMSDPNLKRTYDAHGLLEIERPDGWIGAYSPESRKVRIERFLKKRNHRVWTKTVKYDVRKNFADSRLRVKGRFVKKEDELLMRELMSLT